MAYDPSYTQTYKWRNSTRKAVLATTGGRCQRCGWAGTDGKGRHLQVHHVVRRQVSGSDDIAGLVPLCATCHRHVEAEAKKYRYPQ